MNLHEMYHNYVLYSCAYYVHNISLVSDAEFDQLAKDCLKHRRKGKTIYHPVVKPKHLKAATFSEKREDYPDYFHCLVEKEAKKRGIL